MFCGLGWEKHLHNANLVTDQETHNVSGDWSRNTQRQSGDLPIWRLVKKHTMPICWLIKTVQKRPGKYFWCSLTVAKHQGPYAHNQNWSPQTTRHASLHLLIGCVHQRTSKYSLHYSWLSTSITRTSIIMPMQCEIMATTTQLQQQLSWLNLLICTLYSTGTVALYRGAGVRPSRTWPRKK